MMSIDVVSDTSRHQETARTLQVVLCQLRPEPRNNVANLAKLLRILGEAPEGSLVVTPELYLSGYMRSNVQDVAIAQGHPFLRELRAACVKYGTALVLGFVEEAQGRFFNSMLVIDRNGEDLVCYRKTHLFPGEEEGFDQGDSLASFELDGIQIGLLNCYDIELPEPARALVMQGCEVLVTSSANMWPYFQDHYIPSVARALENRVHHVYVNQVGQGEELYFVGGSRWVRPDGTIGYEARADSESIASVSLAIQDLKPGQENFIASRRPELY